MDTETNDHHKIRQRLFFLIRGETKQNINEKFDTCLEVIKWDSHFDTQ